MVKEKEKERGLRTFRGDQNDGEVEKKRERTQSSIVETHKNMDTHSSLKATI